MRKTLFCLLYLIASPEIVLAQSQMENSNLWPVHRDTSRSAFRISYPPGWNVVPPKGTNTRFSVSPTDGPGNCNVVARSSATLVSQTQEALNREIGQLPMDHESWAGYAGLPKSQVTLIASRRARIGNVPAIIGTLETVLENLEGKYTRKQMVAVTLTTGFVWTVNCGATSFKVEEARARFTMLEPTLNKVFGSFAFLR